MYYPGGNQLTIDEKYEIITRVRQEEDAYFVVDATVGWDTPFGIGEIKGYQFVLSEEFPDGNTIFGTEDSFERISAFSSEIDMKYQKTETDFFRTHVSKALETKSPGETLFMNPALFERWLCADFMEKFFAGTVEEGLTGKNYRIQFTEEENVCRIGGAPEGTTASIKGTITSTVDGTASDPDVIELSVPYFFAIVNNYGVTSTVIAKKDLDKYGGLWIDSVLLQYSITYWRLRAPQIYLSIIAGVLLMFLIAYTCFYTRKIGRSSPVRKYTFLMGIEKNYRFSLCYLGAAVAAVAVIIGCGAQLLSGFLINQMCWRESMFPYGGETVMWFPSVYDTLQCLPFISVGWLSCLCVAVSVFAMLGIFAYAVLRRKK